MNKEEQTLKAIQEMIASNNAVIRAFAKSRDDKFPSKDINAFKKELKDEMRSGFYELNKKIDLIANDVKQNTEYRLRTEGIISVLKWLGAGNVIVFIVYIGSILVK